MENQPKLSSGVEIYSYLNTAIDWFPVLISNSKRGSEEIRLPIMMNDHNDFNNFHFRMMLYEHQRFSSCFVRVCREKYGREWQSR